MPHNEFSRPLGHVMALLWYVIVMFSSSHSQHIAVFFKTSFGPRNMHYEFNIRHMSGVFSGLLKAKPTEFTDAEKLVLLWIHESERSLASN